MPTLIEKLEEAYLEAKGDVAYGLLRAIAIVTHHSDWIKIEDGLPKDGQEVLCYMGNYAQKWKYAVCTFRKGQTKEEVERTRICTPACQSGNNLVPYCWDGSGSMRYFGQYCTHWQPLPTPPTN